MGSMPENSLAGIAAALADGADGVEIDVRATADGELVLMHDDSLQRTTGDPRELSSVTLDELRALRLLPLQPYAETEPPPTLAEALQAVAGRAILVVEVKQAGIHDAVASAIRSARAAGWCWIWAFDPAVAAACHEALPEVPVALNAGRRTHEHYGYASPLEVAHREGLRAISLDHRLVEPVLVEEAHRGGIEVYTWTVNERKDVERVLSAGVDAICGDHPRLIADVVGAAAG
jgi:glycerophosphoryl diester phosphodiesterase